MSSVRIESVFQNLRGRQATAFMPFLTAGDPDLETTARLIRGLDSAGCHLCEIGFPFSDPIADGPVIQASYTRALAAGVRVDQIIETIRSCASGIAMPIVAMVSYSIIYRQGAESFFGRLAQAGVAGVIVPDLPFHESSALQTALNQADIDLIRMITPTTSQERAEQICRSARGFIYYVSVAGVTGERRVLAGDLQSRVQWLKSITNVPVCVGFGVSTPGQAAELAGIADGVIVGSAIVRQIEAISGNEGRITGVVDWCRKFVSVLDPNPAIID